LIEVGRREPQDLEACVHQEVLASVVVDETVPVVGAVVLDDQLRVGVVEVGSGYLSAAGVAKFRLDDRAREAGVQEQPAKSGFHGRLGGFGEESQRGVDARETFAERLVENNQGVDLGQPPAYVGQRSLDSRRRQAAHVMGIGNSDITVEDDHARPRAHTRRPRHRNLDRVHRINVETVNPRRRSAGEDSRR